MDLKYNTQAPKLELPEYGRIVQLMVDELGGIADRKKRTAQAEAIVHVMLRLQPKLRELDDYERKLWDHLHVISGFSLDVDAPYPAPHKEDLHSQPERVPYQSSGVRSGHYGSIVKEMIEAVAALPPGIQRETATLALANQMKRAYLRWNKDTVEDDAIIKDLEQMSNGALDLAEGTMLVSVTPEPNQKMKAPGPGPSQVQSQRRLPQPGPRRRTKRKR